VTLAIRGNILDHDLEHFVFSAEPPVSSRMRVTANAPVPEESVPARVSWARSLTVNPRSTSPPQGCATSPSLKASPAGQNHWQRY